MTPHQHSTHCVVTTFVARLHYAAHALALIATGLDRATAAVLSTATELRLRGAA